MPTKERSLQARVKSLASSECANHANNLNGIPNHCWAKERSNGVCVFFSDLENPQCRYFQETVLPIDKELKAIFSSEVLSLEIQDGRKKMIRRKCVRCPDFFLAKSNRQQFCPKCQKAGRRNKAREWDRANRKSPRRMSQSAI